jgi:hypothetical protein
VRWQGQDWETGDESRVRCATCLAWTDEDNLDVDSVCPACRDPRVNECACIVRERGLRPFATAPAVIRESDWPFPSGVHYGEVRGYWVFGPGSDEGVPCDGPFTTIDEAREHLRDYHGTDDAPDYVERPDGASRWSPYMPVPTGWIHCKLPPWPQ